jgi:hypothetical protein
MKRFLRITTTAAGLLGAANASAQASYRNLDAGFPVRIEDATVTERDALDLDLLNFRYDELSDLRTRFQYEPSIAYGVLPRTEAWVRVPVFYRERGVSPRAGVAGIGIGAMYQLNLETLRVPAVAFASEFFAPTGRNALPPSYSLKTIVTRSLSRVRLHLNGSLASYAVRAQPSLIITCGKAAPGSTCGGTSLPPLDGPCSVSTTSASTTSSIQPDFMCAAQPPSISVASAALPGQIETHVHWLVGAAVDKSWPLSSTLVVADVFEEKFEGIGRKTDATAEIGVRHQLRPQIVFVGAVGRHFRGAGFSTFITAGMTLSRALQLSRTRL